MSNRAAAILALMSFLVTAGAADAGPDGEKHRLSPFAKRMMTPGAEAKLLAKAVAKSPELGAALQAAFAASAKYQRNECYPNARLILVQLAVVGIRGANAAVSTALAPFFRDFEANLSKGNTLALAGIIRAARKTLRPTQPDIAKKLKRANIYAKRDCTYER